MLFQVFIKPYLKILLIIIFGYIIILLGLFVFALQLNEEIDDFTLQTNKLYQHPFQVNAAARIARFTISNSQNGLLYATIHESISNRKSIDKQIDKHWQTFDRSLAIIESNFLGDMKKVVEAHKLAARLQKKHSKIINLLLNDQANDARALINTTQLYEQLLQCMNYIVEFSSNKATDLVKQAKVRAEESRTQLRFLMLLFASFILLSGGVAVIVIIRSLYLRDQILRQSHNNLRISAAAFESQEGMMVTGADLSILRVNKAFTNITGYNSTEVIGKNPSILFSEQFEQQFYDDLWKDVAHSGKWQGEICSKRKNGEEYPQKVSITAVKNIDANITNYVCTLNDLTKSKQAEKKIEDLAYYDPLTHLPNRRLMLDRLQHSVLSSSRSGYYSALFFLDLDQFKTLNDTLGHDIGDQLLIQVAERLVKCVRKSDTVSRFGGDEFVILLENLSDYAVDAQKQAEGISRQILSAINVPYQLTTSHYTDYTVSTSIGITLFNNHKEEIEELLKQADIALYQAKDDGRNTQRFFDPQMQSEISERVAQEEELKQAITEQQFQLYYQLQVDYAQQPVGAEVLIRWIHPERGMISPLDFIPLAEQNGSIVTIGRWVLDSACAQLKVWQNDEATRKLTLSVNVSAKQFHQPDFASNVISVIKRHQINPNRLKLELTESALVDDIKTTIDIMKTLSEIGIQFSLDDFGTGYSSLQYLKQLPLFQLKIDKSFIDDLVTSNNDRAIVRTIIAMAHSLGLNVIAEGVEVPKQQQILFNEGCMHYQGYLFAKPLPINEYNALFKKNKCDAHK